MRALPSGARAFPLERVAAGPLREQRAARAGSGAAGTRLASRQERAASVEPHGAPGGGCGGGCGERVPARWAALHRSAPSQLLMAPCRTQRRACAAAAATRRASGWRRGCCRARPPRSRFPCSSSGWPATRARSRRAVLMKRARRPGLIGFDPNTGACDSELPFTCLVGVVVVRSHGIESGEPPRGAADGRHAAAQAAAAFGDRCVLAALARRKCRTAHADARADAAGNAEVGRQQLYDCLGSLAPNAQSPLVVVTPVTHVAAVVAAAAVSLLQPGSAAADASAARPPRVVHLWGPCVAQPTLDLFGDLL